MEKPLVRIYTDYKSPYAFVANAALFELEEKHGAVLEWRPYTLQNRGVHGHRGRADAAFLAEGALSLYGCQAFRQRPGAYAQGPKAHL